MSNWTIVNLSDVDDSAAGRMDGLEVRISRKQMESRDLGVSLFRYGPNVRNPMSHTATASRRRRTSSSRAPAASGSTTRSTTSGSGTSSASRPRWCAPSRPAPEGLDLIAVGGPKPEGGDGEISDAPWPDA